MALYGHPESSARWQKHLHTILVGMGGIEFANLPSAYDFPSWNLLLCVYVDDLHTPLFLVFASCVSLCKTQRKELFEIPPLLVPLEAFEVPLSSGGWGGAQPSPLPFEKAQCLHDGLEGHMSHVVLTHACACIARLNNVVWGGGGSGAASPSEWVQSS